MGLDAKRLFDHHPSLVMPISVPVVETATVKVGDPSVHYGDFRDQLFSDGSFNELPKLNCTAR